ncbi:bifunctional diguanylate cyclase/phosphodiesterase [Alteromonas pelagimontana]|uniref:Bifunctional diguanylate cyclase/phosphodiesterase n=1 Tax=Alteromonas pelagimontana TaxID=1858656 RepID=A0A6M4MAS3_9ALTE|nr:bifunctional diguanylate cyclase/phosphodiesterase [Alteromonas pelagimontana]QJR79675.1 bifunctional diguanylate cyclase/phosphodiesterase [Alteromonas pelagimontana]
MSRLHQSLATIPNRYAFIDTIDKCAQQHDQFSLMLVDVVRFSDVTTSLGITVGDQFLLEIANRIILLFNEDISFGRISGDVFGIIFPKRTGRTQMLCRFEKLVEHFKVPMQYDNHAFIADFNVGVVSTGKHDFDLTLFVSRAETALKQAKENKYENFYLLTHEEKADTGRSLALKADLKRALLQNELELYFQPQVNLQTLEIIGAECLLRWNHPLDGVLFPGPLIEAAESYNMMNELAYWTFEQAFVSMATLDSAGLRISLSINISPTQLYDSKLIPTLLNLSKRHGIQLSRFELELTEDVALSNSLMVKRQLSQLREQKVAIAVDDFGKGYSNLAYIRELNLNALKIDKTFVMELSNNPVNRAIIEAAKIIGKAKSCDVIAEGVETLEQLHILREIGITMGQGYLFSRAVPINEFITLASADIIVGSSPLRRVIV